MATTSPASNSFSIRVIPGKRRLAFLFAMASSAPALIWMRPATEEANAIHRRLPESASDFPANSVPSDSPAKMRRRTDGRRRPRRQDPWSPPRPPAPGRDRRYSLSFPEDRTVAVIHPPRSRMSQASCRGGRRSRHGAGSEAVTHRAGNRGEPLSQPEVSRSPACMSMLVFGGGPPLLGSSSLKT